MAFTKIAAAGIGSTETVTLHSLEVLNNATVGGVLTYEDVTNVDSVGLITARAGVVVGSGITLSKDGDGFFTGVCTATSFVGDGSALTGITQTTINNNADNRLITGSGTANTLEAEANLTFDGTKLSLTPPANTGNDGLEIIPAGGSTASSFKVLGNQSAGLAAGRNGGVVQIDANYYVESSDIFTVKSRGTTKLNMLGSGNLGLGGNTTPTDALHIKTSVVNTAIATIESTATDSYPFLRLKNDSREYQLSCHGGQSDSFNIYDGTAGTYRLRITSSGQTLVGDSVAQLTTSSERPFQVHSVNGPKIAIGRNDTSIVDGNTIGGLEFYGNDENGTFVNTASIIVNADGTHGNDDKPTRMQFYTTADGGSSATERMRISSAGHVTKPTNLCLQYTPSGSIDITSGTVIYATEVFDVGNSDAYNTSNGEFTAPVTGVYFIQYEHFASNGKATCAIEKNTGSGFSQVKRGMRVYSINSSSDWASVPTIFYMQMNATDKFRIVHSEGTVHLNTPWNHFTVQLVQ